MLLINVFNSLLLKVIFQVLCGQNFKEHAQNEMFTLLTWEGHSAAEAVFNLEKRPEMCKEEKQVYLI